MSHAPALVCPQASERCGVKATVETVAHTQPKCRLACTTDTVVGLPSPETFRAHNLRAGVCAAVANAAVQVLRLVESFCHIRASKRLKGAQGILGQYV